MPCTVLYVKFQFLGIVVSEPVLEEVFSRFGPLEKVQIIQNPLTGASMGYAFVYYKSVEDAKTAKETNATIQGSPIQVGLANNPFDIPYKMNILQLWNARKMPNKQVSDLIFNSKTWLSTFEKKYIS